MFSLATRISFDGDYLSIAGATTALKANFLADCTNAVWPSECVSVDQGESANHLVITFSGTRDVLVVSCLLFLFSIILEDVFLYFT